MRVNPRLKMFEHLNAVINHMPEDKSFMDAVVVQFLQFLEITHDKDVVHQSHNLYDAYRRWQTTRLLNERKKENIKCQIPTQ